MFVIESNAITKLNSYINDILFLSSLEWQIVGRKKECRGTEEFIGNFADIARCADACKDRSSMFIHGIRSEGENGCFCETSALSDGTCDIKDEANYNLYSYVRKGN